MSLPLPIALDAMGGDNAPVSVIQGAELARQRFPWLKFLFYGNAFKIGSLLEKNAALRSACEVVHTDVVVNTGDKPSVALRQGRQSSMRLAIDAVKEGKAFAIVSAGNTGALMAMSKLVLRTLPGISRPAIISLLPTQRGEIVMLDMGANIECDANDLFQFAIMGDAFAKAVLNLTHPRIGILNVGQEEMKGHDEVKMAAHMLRNSKLSSNFHGFVEGNNLAEGTVDVVVTDGFSGNIALKTLEGTAKLVVHHLRRSYSSSLVAKVGYLLSRPALATLKEMMDPRKHNGAMFIGLNGICVKSHGSADALSFANAIGVATELAVQQINRRINEELSLYDVSAADNESPEI